MAKAKPFAVMAKPCDECLFSDRRVVSEKRAAEIVAEALAADGYFICHKSSIKDGQTCCAGFWREHGRDSLTTRFAMIFNLYDYEESE